MANVILCSTNHADTATLSAGSWSATLPRTNLQTLPLSLLARTTNALAASTKLTATWAADQAIRVVSLQHHNFTFAATVRILLKNAAAATIYDQTVDAWAPAFAGPRKPTAEEVAHYPAKHFVHVLPSELTTVRTLTLEITDTANPAGYVQAGRLWAGPGWQPTRNMAYGLQLGWNHECPSARAVGGAEYFGTGYRYRTGRFTLSWLSPTEGMAALDLSGAVGVSGEVLLVLDPATALDLLRTAFPARLRQLSPLEWVSFNLNSMAFEVAEVIP